MGGYVASGFAFLLVLFVLFVVGRDLFGIALTVIGLAINGVFAANRWTRTHGPR
jgi:hypothetical protein